MHTHANADVGTCKGKKNFVAGHIWRSRADVRSLTWSGYIWRGYHECYNLSFLIMCLQAYNDLSTHSDTQPTQGPTNIKI